MVEVSLNSAATTTLFQTISADGIRYANEDESLVFWSKGEEALVMRNNAMDPVYTDCIAQGAQRQ
jgi:membrane-bound inhibitor of C-type lysozyme